MTSVMRSCGGDARGGCRFLSSDILGGRKASAAHRKRSPTSRSGFAVRTGTRGAMCRGAAQCDAASSHGDVESPTTSRRMLLSKSATASAAMALLAAISPQAFWPALAESSTLRSLTPEELDDVRKTVKSAIPQAKAPAVIRLAFHDAGTYDRRTRTGGANGTIRNELERPESIGLKRGIKAVEAAIAKSPNVLSQVSFADAVQLCAAACIELLTPDDALATSRVLDAMRVGRVDAPIDASDPTGRMPSEKAGATELARVFDEQYGFDENRMVVLSGAHTVGAKGFGDGFTFDNAYYQVLLAKPWVGGDDMAQMIGLASDKSLADYARVRPLIEKYANDGLAWSRDFVDAFRAMSELGC
ncbi:L-ascorbate peroxidase [Pycnococcus provasolii]